MVYLYSTIKMMHGPINLRYIAVSQNLALDPSLRFAGHFISFYFYAININIAFISRTKISKVNSMRTF
jgi:hypothetical protein